MTEQERYGYSPEVAKQLAQKRREAMRIGCPQCREAVLSKLDEQSKRGG